MFAFCCLDAKVGIFCGYHKFGSAFSRLMILAGRLDGVIATRGVSRFVANGGAGWIGNGSRW